MAHREMTDQEAWLFAATWGSYINSWDPGACLLYGFDEHFKVQSEQHRADCIARMEDIRAWVEAHPADYEADEIEQIGALIEKLKAAEVAS